MPRYASFTKCAGYRNDFGHRHIMTAIEMDTQMQLGN